MRAAFAGFVLLAVTGAGLFTALHAIRARQFGAGISGTPHALARGHDGVIWFTESAPPRIGRIDRAGHVSEFTRGISGPQLGGIAAGPRDSLWFTESGGRIGRIEADGQGTEFPAPRGAAPAAIAAGPDGNLWFTLPGGIGRMTPAGALREFRSGVVGTPASIAAGPDGNVWFTQQRGVGRITPAGRVTVFRRGIDCTPVSITAGPGGNLWFTDRDCGGAFRGGRIGQITTDGDVTEFSFGLTSAPRAIAADRNLLWFTETGDGGDRVGRITIDGQITEFSRGISADSGLDGIATDGHGQIWFAESRARRIGRISARDPGIN